MVTEQKTKTLEQAVQTILETLADIYPELDINTEDFRETPRRLAKAYIELCQGCNSFKLQDLLGVRFPTNYNGMITVFDIKATGLCPHHLLPVLYTVHFAYIPNDEVVGFSKIPRFIKFICQQPVIQENLTRRIVELFDSYVKPQGCIVVVDAVHTCVCTRGVRDKHAYFETSFLSGCFMEDMTIKQEFISLLQIKR